MITELFIYDRDLGLFKQIFAQSSVIQGRYFVAPLGGPDINSSNLGTYISQALKGMAEIGQKYPCAVCLPPRSAIETSMSHETFLFTILFLTRAGHTGQNQLKQPNADQQASTHQVWHDWKDMKELAVNFLQMLKKVVREKTFSDNGQNKNLIGIINLVKDSIEIKRITSAGNDGVNGVALNFRMQLSLDCETPDYAPQAFGNITVPDLNIHPIHKH